MDLRLLWIICIMICVKSINTANKKWKDKDIRDMSEADLENLLDQWQENDEPLAPDELPEHLRPVRPIDLSKMDTSSPDNVLKMTKKGKSVMMFVNIHEGVDDEKAETIMNIWHTGLRNQHIVADRYPLETKTRSIFLFSEGSQSVDAKNYLLEEPDLSHIVLEGQTYYGKHNKDPKSGRKSEL